MQAQAAVSQLSIEQIAQRIFTSRKISRSDQQWLMSAMLSKDSINTEEQTLIARLFQSLQKGTIRVVDWITLLNEASSDHKPTILLSKIN